MTAPTDLTFAADPAEFYVEFVIEEQVVTTNELNEQEFTWETAYGPEFGSLRQLRRGEMFRDDRTEAHAQYAFICWYDEDFTPNEKMRLRLTNTDEVLNILNYDDVDRQQVFWRFICEQEK